MSRNRRIPAFLATLALATLAQGCSNAIKPPGSAAIAKLLPVLEGRAFVPSQVIANNTGSLVANNGGGLIANNGGGIIAGNSSRYGLFALDAVPLAHSLAYLTDPNDEFYKAHGEMITTTTNARGGFRFASGVPAGVPVIVNVILGENRRVVGFTVPHAGASQLDISVATTYVTEFLRRQAKAANKTMADFDLQALPGLAGLTGQALDASELAVPDLGIGNIAALTMSYALAVGENVEGLGDAWAQLLGVRTLAMTTVAGSGVTDYDGDGKDARSAALYRVKGVCKNKAGDIFIADEGNHAVRAIDHLTGKISTIAGTGTRGFDGDGGPANKALLNYPRAVILDAQENLVIFDSQNCRVRQVDHLTHVITTIAGKPESKGNGFWKNDFQGDGGPATQAKLFAPLGGAFDSHGNLYIVDGLKGTNYHTIRRVTADGTIRTIAGVPNAPGSFSGDGGPATQAHFNYINQIWCTPTDQLYVADANNHCVRKIDLATGIVTTVAGVGGQDAKSADPEGLAAAKTHLNTPYGVAVDAKGQVFIAEKGFHRILGLKADGTLRTLGGDGDSTGEGDAHGITLAEPHDLFVEADGNLLVTDTRNSRVRRLWTRFGM